MRFLIVAAFSLAAPGAAASPATAEPHSPALAPPPSSLPVARGAICDRADIHWAENVRDPVARRLTELPPGDTILAVYREREDGCIDPVIVRYGDGRRPVRGPAPDAVRPRPRMWR